METTLNYFSLLGVTEDAGQDEIEARYRELAEYFASPAIPPSLREWADREAALLDEAYAVLTDPGRRTAALSRREAGSDGAPAATDVREAGSQSDIHPEPRASAPHAAAAPEPTARDGRQSVSALSAILHGIPWKPLALGVATGVVALAAIVVGRDVIDGLGGSGEGAEAPVAGEIVPLDTERVAELMTQVQQDRNNKDVLFELGETFFLAEQWQSGIDWFSKFLELDPNNVHARTDVGTAQFNLGQYEAAKTSWLTVLQVEPNDVQAHYNLGFFYANVEPFDLASAQAEWEAVVRLAPESELAQTAQVHLEGIAEQPPAEASPATAATP